MIATDRRRIERDDDIRFSRNTIGEATITISDSDLLGPSVMLVLPDLITAHRLRAAVDAAMDSFRGEAGGPHPASPPAPEGVAG